MSDARQHRLVAGFQQAFGTPPTAIARAPGRVNLIGEHTDYNDGFCLPMAIEREMRIAVGPGTGDRLEVVDLNLETAASSQFSISPAITKDPACRWADYLKGCAQVLVGEGLPLRGARLVLDGDVPVGSGLSSSAALEVATILALLQVAGLDLPRERIARLAQRAENTYVGTRCGILDQLASACCQAGTASLMDCRTLSLTPVPLPPATRVVIADTGRRRGLVDSAYNERRAQCEAGAKALGVPFLRDAHLHGLSRAAQQGRLDATALARCQHVVAENGRTLAAAACLRAGDAVAFGALMDQSHADLRDRFAVTCTELDDMVTIARSLPGCLGSRMTGAGFGGCTVSLVQESAVAAFVPALEDAYRRLHALPVAVYVTGAAPGAGTVRL